MGARKLTTDRHCFGDCEVGDQIETGSADITAEQIDAFADLSDDSLKHIWTNLQRSELEF